LPPRKNSVLQTFYKYPFSKISEKPLVHPAFRPNSAQNAMELEGDETFDGAS
jgi:hypothetical protein